MVWIMSDEHCPVRLATLSSLMVMMNDKAEDIDKKQDIMTASESCI